MEIGDRIRVLACVKTSYVSPEDMHRYYQLKHTPKVKFTKDVKYLYRCLFDQERSGFFLGWTYIATGTYDAGDFGTHTIYEVDSYPTSSFLCEDMRHRVAVVALIGEPGKFQRYIQPIHCLPEDIHED